MHSLKRSLSQTLALSVLAISLGSPAVMADKFSLVTENFPPLNMSNNGKNVARNSQVSGLATDIIRQLLENTGHSASYHMKSSWHTALNSAADKSGYGVYSAFRTPEREERFKWVGPLYNEDWVLLAKADVEENIQSLDDVKGRTIGSFEKDPITDYLKGKNLSLRLASNDGVNVARLRNGTIDLWASSSLTGPYVASSFRFPVKTVLTFSEGQLWLAMNKDTDDEVITALNTELQRMHDDGEIEEVLSRYR